MAFFCFKAATEGKILPSLTNLADEECVFLAGSWEAEPAERDS